MPPTPPKHNINLAINLAAFAAGMVMLAYAAVPLYDVFCRVTGYGGTTGTAQAAPDAVLERNITVHFNADVQPGLPWRFQPGQRETNVKIGAETLTWYTAENLSEKDIKGHAIYNVVPHKAGPYFNKIACFCFEDQTLKAGEHVNMPVNFFIDPAMADDPELKNVKEITLSYTFFPATPETE